MSLSTADVAYCAALIDNLAALRARTLGPSTLPVVQVSGKWSSLSWLADLTGTKLIETNRKFSRHNCVEHCPDRHAHIESRSARWSITGMRATIVLANCEPYLRVQAPKARELIDHGLGVQYQGQVVRDMRQRGWVIPELTPHPRARIPITEAS